MTKPASHKPASQQGIAVRSATTPARSLNGRLAPTAAAADPSAPLMHADNLAAPNSAPMRKAATILLALALALGALGLCSCNASTDDLHPTSPASTAASSIASIPSNPDDASQLPAYTGSAYTVVASNVPELAKVEVEYGYESYSALDSLGRCGEALALVGRETMPTDERGSIGSIKPSGWQTVRYDDLVDGKYLYNRCHLIGYQLSGENANERNLITGTRYLNVMGMLPFEDEVADYVKRTGNHVLYRATPVFIGDELVARGVHLEALSVEDNGEAVSFNVFCHNVQPGIEIDYATGSSWLADDEAAGQAPQEPAESSAESTATSTNSNASEGTSTNTSSNGNPGTTASDAIANAGDAAITETVTTYVLNTNTKRFHLPSCPSASSMKSANREEVASTRGAIISDGYEPCSRCNP